MQLVEKTGFVQKNTELAESTFTIRASAKAYAILSGQLYTNKVRAIIRELLCNAIDAHTAAGTQNLDIILQLPNTLDSTFRVRDFGTGISPGDIASVYTKYFESTKTSSNDYIGALGLGSKTPFCYTDNFLVNSYYKGIKYSYACIINEEGMPVIDSLGTEPTAEHDGLEVSFAVKNADHATFKKEAEFVLFWFKRLPIVQGQTLEISKSTPVISGKGWSVVELVMPQSNYGGYYNRHRNDEAQNLQGAWVTMGNVAYRIEQQSFTSLTPEQTTILGLNVHIDCPIGSVEVAASREQLSLNKPTIAYLKKRLSEIAAEARATYEKELDLNKSYWDAAIARHEKMILMSPSLRSIIESSPLSYKGKILVKTLEIPHNTFTLFARETNQSGDIISRKEVERYVEPRKNIAFVKVEAGWKEGKIRAWCRRNDKNFTKIVVLDGSIQHDLATAAEISAEYLFTLDQLPEPVKSVGTRSAVMGKKKSDVYVYEFDEDFPKKFSKITSVDFSDEDEEYIYVNSRYKEPLLKRADASLVQIQVGLRELAKTYPSVLIKKLYGLTESQSKSVADSDNWIDLDTFLADKIDKILDDKLIYEYVLASYLTQSRNALSLWNCKNTIFLELVNQLGANHQIGQFMDQYNKYEETLKRASKATKDKYLLLSSYDLKRMIDYSTKFQDKIEVPKTVESAKILTEAKKKETQLFLDYPVLTLFANPTNSTNPHSNADMAKVLLTLF